MPRGSDRLPLNCFHLRGANASQLGAISGDPSVGRASCSNGTLPVTSRASASRCWLFVRIPEYPTSGTSRSSLVNTFVFLPVVLHHGTQKRDSVVKVLKRV